MFLLPNSNNWSFEFFKVDSNTVKNCTCYFCLLFVTFYNIICWAIFLFKEKKKNFKRKVISIDSPF